jgi:hypothetical protein
MNSDSIVLMEQLVILTSPKERRIRNCSRKRLSMRARTAKQPARS